MRRRAPLRDLVERVAAVAREHVAWSQAHDVLQVALDHLSARAFIEESRRDDVTEEELKRMVAEARARYDALSPEAKRAHDYEQRRSFARGMCPSHRDYVSWCKEVDRIMPPLEIIPVTVTRDPIDRLKDALEKIRTDYSERQDFRLFAVLLIDALDKPPLPPDAKKEMSAETALLLLFKSARDAGLVSGLEYTQNNKPEQMANLLSARLIKS